MTMQGYEAQLEQLLGNWQPDYVGTLVFIRRGGEVLLIRKKRGHGAGKINGPGGKLDPGETPLAGALRETLEEVGVQVLDAELRGRFSFVDLSAPQWLGYVFVATQFSGSPHPTDEADPAWYALDALPFDQMWEDDRFWLPRVLSGESLQGEFLFDGGRLLAHRLRSAPDL